MIDNAALDILFREARTANAFTAQTVNDAQLKAVFDLARMGPTSGNCQPGRFVYLRSADARARLLPALSPGNLEKTRSAPVTVIVAHDSQFHDLIPKLFPHAPQMRDMFVGEERRAAREATAFRNGTLQGAYFMLAARSVGLACGAMSGFDAAKVDAEFFPDGRFKSNFLINLGYGDMSKTMARNPRLDFTEACQLL